MKLPGLSLSQTKRLMRDLQRIAAQAAEEGQFFKERLKSAEAREAFAAFAERGPQFCSGICLTLGYLRTPTRWLEIRLSTCDCFRIIQRRRRCARLAATALR
ncbi:hypothetical protein [Tardiphaga sp.]|uniref:hypothetical protein n=1 Tax=Tardiphaga sp. TaxID=1926292 RepID=UPI00261CF15F|nr:hypothetical protein [Tardiphaga sp.]